MCSLDEWVAHIFYELERSEFHFQTWFSREHSILFLPECWMDLILRLDVIAAASPFWTSTRRCGFVDVKMIGGRVVLQ